MALSGQAAIASENINLLEETSRRANQLETAAEIAAQASSTLDTDALLNRAVNLIRDRFGYYHASIFLIDDQRAVVAASTGEAGQQLVNNRHSLEIQEGKSIRRPLDGAQNVRAVPGAADRDHHVARRSVGDQRCYPKSYPQTASLAPRNTR